MRIYFDSIDHPKKAAKRLKKCFETVSETFGSSSFFGSAIIKPIKLSEAQSLTANMLGYEDWHELEETIKSKQHPSSKFDEEISEEEEEKRNYYQWERLNEKYPTGFVNQINNLSRVSAKTPTSNKLDIKIGFENSIYYIKDEKTWKFSGSMRSDMISTKINDMQESFTTGNINLGNALDYCEGILKEAPENCTAMWFYLGSISNYEDVIDDKISIVIEMEKEYLSWFPEGFFENENIYFTWNDMDNRDLIRIAILFSQIFYTRKDFKKAKEWFSITSRMNDYFNYGYRYMIKDVNSDNPRGDKEFSE